MLFEYNSQQVFMNQIEVKDIGNVGLRCSNDDGIEYYYVAKTSLGKTYILKYGPTVPDVEQLVPKFTLEYDAIDYKEPKIIKDIEKFIQDFRKKITQVEVLDLEEATDCLPRVVEIFRNLD